MITATPVAQSLPVKAQPGISRWRYLGNAVFVLTFLYCFFLAYNEQSVTPTLGISAEQPGAGDSWSIATVEPQGQAAKGNARQGDLIRMIDGRTIDSVTVITQEQLDHATQIVLERPITSETFTLTVTPKAPQTLSVQPHFVLSIVFLVVGVCNSLFGRGAAPQALALLCSVGALEALTIPFTNGRVQWAVLINGIGVPLFMGSFAYLFLVFPIKRPRAFRGRPLPAIAVLLPAPFLSLLNVFASLNGTPFLINLNRLFGFPYFLTCLLGGGWLLVRSWRRMETARERAQLRLIAIGTLMAIVPVISLTLIPSAIQNREIVPSYFTVLPRSR